MAQVVESLQVIQETQMEFSAAGLGLTQLQCHEHLGSKTRDRNIMIPLSLYSSLYQIYTPPHTHTLSKINSGTAKVPSSPSSSLLLSQDENACELLLANYLYLYSSPLTLITGFSPRSLVYIFWGEIITWHDI